MTPAGCLLQHPEPLPWLWVLDQRDNPQLDDRAAGHLARLKSLRLLFPNVVFQPTAAFERHVFDEIGDRDDGRSPLSQIMHSLKSYTAHEANKILGESGSFWQRESYDHWIRSEEELERLVEYVQANPVKAGLSQRPEDYWWCSCHDRVLQDGEVTAWLGWK